MVEVGEILLQIHYELIFPSSYLIKCFSNGLKVYNLK